MTPVALDASTCWQLTLALWHTTWIGVLVGCLAAAGNWLLWRGSAPQRYALNFGALLVVGASLPLTFAVIRWTEPVIDAAPPAASVSVSESTPTESETDMQETAHVSPPIAPSADPAIASAMQAEMPTENEEGGTGVPSAAPVEPSAAHSLRDHVRAAAPFITVVYLFGVVAMLVKLLAAIYGGQRLRAAGRPVTDPQLLDILARQSRRLALRFVPVVAYCERVAVPVVIGVIRPMILAPAVMVSGLTADELVAVLTHELAHIRRYDHLLILVQRFVESALFFHPAVWYLSRRVHHERETCCDDLVVAANGDRLTYARSLLRVAELRLTGDDRRTQLAALAADGQRPSELRQRIARLLGDSAETNIRFRNRWPATLLGVTCAAAIWAMLATTWQVVAEIKRDRSETELADFAIETEDVLDPRLHSGEVDPADDGDAKRKQAQAVETWLENLAGVSAEQRAQAAAEIKQWRIEKPLDEIDPRLIKALARLLDNEEMARHGPLTQRVGDWCREALAQIGKPAVAELIAIAGKGPDKLRKRVVESLGAIQAVGPKGVEVLIGLLDHANYEVSGAAVSALARLNDEPTLIPKLIEATKNGPLPTRYRAVGVLGHFDDERVNPVILKALDDDERLVRLWGVHAAGQKPRLKLAAEFISRLKTDDLEFRGPLETVLFRMAKDAVEPLIAGMDDDDPRVRAGCIIPLRETMPETALRVAPLVIRSLTDKDAAVRRQALMHVAFAARWFERDLLVEPLVKNLGDKDAELREQAADALRNFAETWPTERRPVEPLLAALDDAEPAVVAAAVRALAAFREPKAIAVLVRLAEAGGEPGRAASEALGVLGDQRGREVLRQNLAKKLTAAIEALGKLHDRQSIPQFIELLNDPGDDVRSAAAKALALNPDPRAVEPLIAGLKKGFGGGRQGLRGDRYNTTRAIADALGHSGDRRGIAAMIDATDDAVNPLERPFGDEFEPAHPQTLDIAISQHPFAWPLFRAGLPALPELAKGLSAPSPTTRQVCAWVLDNLAVQGDLEAADFNGIRAPLLAGLRDDDPVVRFCLVKTIGRLKLRGSEAYLLKLLETPVSEAAPAAVLPRNSLPAATQIQVEVIRALSQFQSDRVRDALLRALEHPEPAVRAAAVGHLGHFPAALTVGPLLKALADPGAAAEAARVLGHLGDPRAIAPLVEALKSSASPTVRANAAQSLGLLGAADAKAALRDVLEQIPAAGRQSERIDLQVATAVSLVQLQDEAGTARLKELLESPDPQTRYAAASRLNLATYFSEWRPPARLTHEPTRTLMRHFAEHAPDTPTRLQLLEALRGQIDQQTREFLEGRGNDPNDPLRWAAWRALARPNPAAYETQLLAMLDDSDDQTRRDIVFFLAQIASPRVTDRLLALTSSGDDELRIAVTAGLAKHRSPAVDARLGELAANDPSPQVRLRAAKVLAAAAVPEK